MASYCASDCRQRIEWLFARCRLNAEKPARAAARDAGGTRWVTYVRRLSSSVTSTTVGHTRVRRTHLRFTPQSESLLLPRAAEHRTRMMLGRQCMHPADKQLQLRYEASEYSVPTRDCARQRQTGSVGTPASSGTVGGDVDTRRSPTGNRSDRDGKQEE